MSSSECFLDSADSLKLLDEISVVDPRNEHIELSDWHAQLAEISLLESAPKEVKQLFENAKNVALYAYFAYRLHQPAELVGYSALEKALKIKFEMEKENISVQRVPSRLVDYMNVALDHDWISNEGYESSRPIAESRVHHKKVFEIIESGVLDVGQSIVVPEPEAHEVIQEMNSMDIAKTRLHAGRHVRNSLSHGEGGLSPSSIGTLRLIAEEINQLFTSIK